MDSIRKVNSICKSVLKLTDDDFTAVCDIAKEQSDYSHPLKMGTAARINDLGSHNQRVIAALKNLQDVIKAGEEAATRKVKG
jgi:hypothetical protein